MIDIESVDSTFKLLWFVISLLNGNISAVAGLGS